MFLGEFHLHLINCRISVFDNMATVLIDRRSEFHGMKLSLHNYQLSVSQEIK